MHREASVAKKFRRIDMPSFMNVRKLAALDIVFHGPKLILVEFAIGVLLPLSDRNTVPFARALKAGLHIRPLYACARDKLSAAPVARDLHRTQRRRRRGGLA